jgi:hypothetical protein
VSPERARWERERRPVVEELRDGAVVVELPFAGTDWLVREVMKEAGDAAVLEPEDAREAVLAAAKRLEGQIGGRRGKARGTKARAPKGRPAKGRGTETGAGRRRRQRVRAAA